MIQADVLLGHLAEFPEEIEVARALERDFDVKWAKKFKLSNADVSAYILNPCSDAANLFGFQREVLFIYSEFKSIQPRVIQCAQELSRTLPIAGRVDPNVILIGSRDKDVVHWIKEYISINPLDRAYVGIYVDQIEIDSSSWLIRNIISTQLYSRDMFDYTLPIDQDLFFFGRQPIVSEYVDAVKKSENRGLFGLRKTGKTSILLKVKRQCEADGVFVLYFDCKLSSIYLLTADELLDKIADEIKSHFRIYIKDLANKKYPSDRLMSIISAIPTGKKVCLIFDEIEQIFFFSNHSHWADGFIPFWQTIWSIQSQFRKFNFIISGVNSLIVETDKLNSEQNPMFGIVKARYLTGFDREEVSILVRTFGGIMGMKFDEGSIDFLLKRYGGHPLLVRMICSQINNEAKVAKRARPINIYKHNIEKDVSERESEIEFYCGHITSELASFYPVEYEMLEMLAIGNEKDFIDLSSDPSLVRHLNAYGLVDFSFMARPKFKIPVIKNYIANGWRRKTGSESTKYVVPEHRREQYVCGRVLSIIRDMRVAEKKFKKFGLPNLYSGAGPRESDMLASMTPVSNQGDAVNFLNQCNRSLIEPIDEAGRPDKGYFFSKVARSYPFLWPALNRVRAYRNAAMHANLTASADNAFEKYLDEDFDGKRPETVADGWFRLQAAILDGIAVGLHAELSQYD